MSENRLDLIKLLKSLNLIDKVSIDLSLKLAA